MFESSMVSYGEKGRDKRYGSNSYRGNTDGGIVKDFLDYCEKKMGNLSSCSDYMVGSGTTKDVCKERGISGTYWDLSMGKNLLDPNLDIPDRPETIFWHPPYSSHIGIPYAGVEWGADKEWVEENGKKKCIVHEHLEEYVGKYGFDPKKYDLGRMDWDEFVRALNYCCMKMYAALETGGRMGILMGDVRRNGKYYSMLLDIAKPGDVESIVIKKQNNVSSQGRMYGNNTFIPIAQEYFLILKKLAPYILDFSYSKQVKLDIRDSKDASWKDVILAVMSEMNGPCRPIDIARALEGHKKAEGNNNVDAKVRQVLQILLRAGLVQNENGTYHCAAA